jgi:hypothetical protein
MAGVLAAEAAKSGAQVAWVAPTYTNSRPMWRFVELVAGQDSRVTVRRAEREIIMPGNGRLGVYTADNPVGLRGESFDIVMMDEAPQYKPEVWTDVVMPTLADRDGIAYLIGTPKGKNWFYLEYMRGLSDGKNQVSFTAPSSANPNQMIRRAALLAKERVSDRTYRQEWLAEFVADGAFFTNVDRCATANITASEKNKKYTIGVDWARSSGGDYTVFIVIDVQTKSMAFMERMAGQPFDVQQTRLRELCSKYNNAFIMAEYNAMGGPLVEQLQTEGLPVQGFVTTSQSKHALITSLELAFDRMEISILSDPVLLAELNSYEKKDRVGLPSYGAPDGQHDDTVIALALAWHAIVGGSRMEVMDNPFDM